MEYITATSWGKKKCIMNLPLLSENTFLLRSLDLILKGLEIKPKASHTLSKSATTEQELLSQVFWTGPQWESSAKLTQTMQSLEKKSKSVYQIQYKKCVYVSLGKASISCLLQKWVCTLKSVWFFWGAIYFKYSCVPPFPARRGL